MISFPEGEPTSVQQEILAKAPLLRAFTRKRDPIAPATPFADWAPDVAAQHFSYRFQLRNPGRLLAGIVNYPLERGQVNEILNPAIPLPTHRILMECLALIGGELQTHEDKDIMMGSVVHQVVNTGFTVITPGTENRLVYDSTRKLVMTVLVRGFDLLRAEVSPLKPRIPSRVGELREMEPRNDGFDLFRQVVNALDMPDF